MIGRVPIVSDAVLVGRSLRGMFWEAKIGTNPVYSELWGISTDLYHASNRDRMHAGKKVRFFASTNVESPADAAPPFLLQQSTQHLIFVNTDGYRTVLGGNFSPNDVLNMS